MENRRSLLVRLFLNRQPFVGPPLENVQGIILTLQILNVWDIICVTPSWITVILTTLRFESL